MDYKSMPMGTLAFATHFLWSITDGVRRGYAKVLGEAKAKVTVQRADALAKAFVKKSNNKRLREDTIERLAISYFQDPANRNSNNSDAAAHVFGLVRGSREFSGMTQDGIHRKLAGAKKRAIALLLAKSR